MLKIPTLVKNDDELTKEFTEELPTRIDEVAAVRLAIPVEDNVVLFATKFDPTLKLSAFTVPVWYTPVVLATKLDPIVNEEELTPKDTFADPDISRLTAGVDIPIPILLLIESTNIVPESKLTLPDIVCNPPLSVVFPEILALPDTDS